MTVDEICGYKVLTCKTKMPNNLKSNKLTLLTLPQNYNAKEQWNKSYHFNHMNKTKTTFMQNKN